MAKINTSKKILDTSRDLFNKQGVESVSIAQIAQKLDISTGNLTYHFTKKKDILAEHIKALEQDIVDVLEKFPYGGSARQFLNSYSVLFRLTWDYRFLFTGTSFLLQHDLLRKSEYQTLVDHVYDVFLEQIEKMMESGLLKPISEPHCNRTLVDCIWWQWLGWLNANQLLPKNGRMVWEQLLESGIRHMLFLVHPYMQKQFRQELYEKMPEQPAIVAYSA